MASPKGKLREQSEVRQKRAEFFARVRMEALLSGSRNVRAHVSEAWKREFNEELSPARYGYFAYDPEHAQQRNISYERVLSDGAHELTRGAETQVSVNLERAWDFLEAVRTDPRMRSVTGASVLRVRSPATGDWEDLAVRHEKPPEGIMKEVLHLIGRLVDARVKLGIATHAPSHPSAGFTAAGARAEGGHAEVTVVVEKAKPYLLTRDDEAPKTSHFTQAQVDALIEQEGDPFGIPQDDSFSYAEFMKLQRLALKEAEALEAAGLLPSATDASGREMDERDAAVRREMLRGVVLDPKAVADAEVAALSIPSPGEGPRLAGAKNG